MSIFTNNCNIRQKVESNVKVLQMVRSTGSEETDISC